MKGIVTEISMQRGMDGQKTIKGTTGGQPVLAVDWRTPWPPLLDSEFELDPSAMEVEWDSIAQGRQRGPVSRAKHIRDSRNGAVTEPATPSQRAGLPPVGLWADVQKTAAAMGVEVDREQDESDGAWYLIVKTGRGRVEIEVSDGWDAALVEAGLLDVSF